MAIMPIWERAPLMTRERVPLSPGAVHARRAEPAALVARLPADIPVCCLEGAVQLAACGYENSAENAVRGWMKSQGADGAFSLNERDALCVARSVWALHLWRRDRETMASTAAWLQWVADNYDSVAESRGMREQPADLMELALSFYRVTGKNGALLLAARLRRDCFDWATALRTFDLQRPMGRLNLDKTAETSGEQAAYLERVRVLGNAVMLADGLRFAGLCADYSGSGTALGAAQKGWERIVRWHGLPCGGTSADPMLQGRGADTRIDPEAVGAWAEVLADADANEEWAFDALERLTENALTSVSRCPEQKRTMNTRHVEKDGALTDATLGRLLRGWAAVLSHTVTLRRDGVELNRLEEGAFACVMDGKAILLQLSRDKVKQNTWQLSVQTKTPTKGMIRFRLPYGTEADVRINGELTDGRIERVWQTDDVLTIQLNPRVTVEEGYHQSRAVYDGPTLMAVPAPVDGCGYALEKAGCGSNGAVLATVRTVKGQKGDDVPVLPETAGEPVELQMRPFADDTTGWSMFAAVRS